MADAPAKRGVVWNVLGQRVRCLMDGSETGGTMSVFEETAPGRTAVPPHTHSREDEAFVMLAGELEATVGGVTRRLGPGDTVFLPMGVEHSFRNPGARDARFVVIARPAGFEKFFEEIDREVGRAEGTPDMARVMRVVEKHGLTMRAP